MPRDLSTAPGKCVLLYATDVSSHDAFGPNLRRRRLQQRIALEEIAARTNVSLELWEGLERNDLSRWPTGVAARAYIRDYASILDLDPDETVDEFCRVTPHGDRRRARQLQETAALLRHQVLVWRDDLPAGTNRERRTAPGISHDSQDSLSVNTSLRPRVAVLDLIVVVVLAAGVSAAFRVNVWTTLLVTTLLYHGLSTALLGCAPTIWMLDAFVSARRPWDHGRLRSVFRGVSLLATKRATQDHRAAD